ncbi:YraN family protein [Vibrio fluvialis]|uniref:YraN family protein n=1 Tax=Vibrio fluvialis TaxID=676 RepID=UPI001C9E1505|nr:YraN family protein [Vibrio fluvialis]MBY7783625.1 YraN family protein [Vibrio fluvialis]MCE7598360.1 YraN family protein [Vibrio fluvialis]
MGLFSRRLTGQHYETTAAEYLRRRGLFLIEQNFQIRGGELDLIMRENQTLVFVEVKYRQNQRHGHAAEMVTRQKQARLIKAANWWMLKQGLSADNTDFRFDVVAIHDEGRQIDWIKNAITEG